MFIYFISHFIRVLGESNHPVSASANPVTGIITVITNPDCISEFLNRMAKIQPYGCVDVMRAHSDQSWSPLWHKFVMEKLFFFHVSGGKKKSTGNQTTARGGLVSKQTCGRGKKGAKDGGESRMNTLEAESTGDDLKICLPSPHSSSWLVNPDWVCIPLAVVLTPPKG